MKLLPTLAAAMALYASSAQASLVIIPIINDPSIWERVTQTTSGEYNYTFGMPAWSNGFVTVTEIDLPWFADAGLTAPIQAPTGWQVSIKDSPFYGLAGSKTLVLLAPSGGLSGDMASGSFTFSSIYAPVKSPYAVHYTYGTYVGDPYIPGSPDAIASGLQPAPLNAVPEPATVSMLLLGMGLMGASAARKKLAHHQNNSRV